MAHIERETGISRYYIKKILNEEEYPTDGVGMYKKSSPQKITPMVPVTSPIPVIPVVTPEPHNTVTQTEAEYDPSSYAAFLRSLPVSYGCIQDEQLINELRMYRNRRPSQ